MEVTKYLQLSRYSKDIVIVETNVDNQRVSVIGKVEKWKKQKNWIDCIENLLMKDRYLKKESCIMCRTYHHGCLQPCIIKDSSYKIQQQYCLPWGLCFENYPTQAMKRRGY